MDNRSFFQYDGTVESSQFAIFKRYFFHFWKKGNDIILFHLIEDTNSFSFIYGWKLFRAGQKVACLDLRNSLGTPVFQTLLQVFSYTLKNKSLRHIPSQNKHCWRRTGLIPTNLCPHHDHGAPLKGSQWTWIIIIWSQGGSCKSKRLESIIIW